MKKFWNWKKKAVNLESGQEAEERILFMNGVIAEDSWFDDDVTPALFKDELNAGTGDITLWINSPGGDCVAAAQIFNMLSEYPGKVTVKIDGLAASAASVIALAGTEVWMSPVSMMMIHNPATVAWGDHSEMNKLERYYGKTGKSVKDQAEIGLNGNGAGMQGTGISGSAGAEGDDPCNGCFGAAENACQKCEKKKVNTNVTGRSADDLRERLNFIKKYI